MRDRPRFKDGPDNRKAHYYHHSEIFLLLIPDERTLLSNRGLGHPVYRTAPFDIVASPDFGLPHPRYD
jgi:hypothetical protein